MRVVIDTNLWVSSLLTKGDIMRQVIEAWRRKEFDVLSSPQTRAELTKVLEKPYIRERSVVPLQPFVDGLESFSVHVPGNLELEGVCRDPNDEIFLACAIEGQAQYLMSSDGNLLDLSHFKEVSILNPGQFLVALHLATLSAEDISQRLGREAITKILSDLPLDENTRGKLQRALAQD
jgi:hypothetical protein